MPLQEIDVEEVYKKDDKLKKENVNTLMEWIKLQPHLPQVTELQTVLFLQSCYYRNELTKTTIDTYFTVKTLCPDIFGNRDPALPSLQLALKTILMTYLPKLTPEGDRVFLIKLIDANPEKFNFLQLLKSFDMLTSAHLHKNGPDNGVIILFDLKGLVFGHFLKFNALLVKKFLYYLQEGLPIRLKSIQFSNIVSFMDKILALMKPFMKKELIDALVLHNDMENVYKTIPKDIFPQDYGGSCEPSDVLLEKYQAIMNDSIDLFKFQDSQVVDESRRPGKPKNVNDLFGVEGTFKKLDVD